MVFFCNQQIHSKQPRFCSCRPLHHRLSQVVLDHLRSRLQPRFISLLVCHPVLFRRLLALLPAIFSRSWISWLPCRRKLKRSRGRPRLPTESWYSPFGPDWCTRAGLTKPITRPRSGGPSAAGHMVFATFCEWSLQISPRQISVRGVSIRRTKAARLHHHRHRVAVVPCQPMQRVVPKSMSMARHAALLARISFAADRTRVPNERFQICFASCFGPLETCPPEDRYHGPWIASVGCVRGLLVRGSLSGDFATTRPDLVAILAQGPPLFQQEFDDSEFSDVQMAEIVRVRCEAAGIVSDRLRERPCTRKHGLRIVHFTWVTRARVRSNRIHVLCGGSHAWVYKTCVGAPSESCQLLVSSYVVRAVLRCGRHCP